MRFARVRRRLPLIVAVEYFIDYRVFRKHGNFGKKGDRDRRVFYQAVISAHALEKGLSLPSVRPFFGKDKIRTLISSLEQIDPENQPFPLEMANGALREYVEFHEGRGSSSPVLAEACDYLGREACRAIKESGGTKSHLVSERVSGEIAKSFLLSRRSCRYFSGIPLEEAEILEVLRVAQSAPSQCNRQSVRVHVYRHRAQIAQLLDLQGGSRGFGEGIDTLFLVTSDMAAWLGAAQRNQAYVDGGIYALSLALALHACGFEACMLNLATRNRVEKRIRTAGDVPGNERLIVMIAAGHAAQERIKVAASPRRGANDILNLHN